MDDDSLLTYAEYFMTINPISNAWPYWREFVQNMSSRMGFPALTVPLLGNRAEKSRDEKSEKSACQKGVHPAKEGQCLILCFP